jgi:uncharacterized spore protein YtfJ
LQVTKFRNEFSQEARVKGGVPQGSKIEPIAFIIHINDLPLIISPINQEDEDISLFMDDTTLSEVIDITQHVSNCPIVNSQRNVDNILQFTRNQNMELNSKKCKEMLVDFRKVKTIIPAIAIGGDIFTRVKSFKLPGIWIDDDLKWNTNTVYIIKRAVKRLYLLKVLKGYNAAMEDLKAFYTGVIRSVLEYGAQIWNGNLTVEQSNDIERLQKRALRIILPGMSYDHALRQSNLKTLKERRDVMCVDMIKKMSNPGHKLHHLLPMKVSQLRERETRTNGLEYYNYACRTTGGRKVRLCYINTLSSTNIAYLYHNNSQTKS